MNKETKYATMRVSDGKHYNRETKTFVDEAIYSEPLCCTRRHKKDGSFKTFTWPVGCVNVRIS